MIQFGIQFGSGWPNNRPFPAAFSVFIAATGA